MANLIGDGNDKTLTVANVINVFNGDMSTFISTQEFNSLTVDEFGKLKVTVDDLTSDVDYKNLVIEEWDK